MEVCVWIGVLEVVEGVLYWVNYGVGFGCVVFGDVVYGKGMRSVGIVGGDF